MMQYLLNRGSRAAGLAGLVAAVLAAVAVHPAPAAADTTIIPTGLTGMPPADTSACMNPALSQTFLSTKDRKWYTLAPGQSPGGFTGAGWTLANGARIANTQLQNGQPGSVLDLPSGAVAISPPMCVTSDYPTARSLVRNVIGGEGVQFYVSYAGTRTWEQPKDTGQLHGQQNNWTVSNPVNVQPDNHTVGWQIVRFAFVAGGRTSDFQVYDFYVDPRMKA
ncbi:MAG TPA: hypothetical protein VH279_10840 [Solirubrobacteraceae bacterium]|jgi:hypothetical protein|nr:hypothetical protein [Solirubrobacteraceae bacterium]